MTTKRLQAIVESGGPFPDARDWSYVNDVYDAAVARMDDVVMTFIEGVEEVFADEPFLLILTSDHGEEINDHGSFGHGQELYEEVTRVPLIVRFPDRSRVGRSREPSSGLALDPDERNNLAKPLSAAIEAHRNRLREYRLQFFRVVRPREKRQPSPPLLEELRALGYAVDE